MSFRNRKLKETRLSGRHKYPSTIRIWLIIWFILIWVLSSLPASEVTSDVQYLDKAVHLSQYFILGILVFLNFRQRFFGSLNKQLVLAIFLLLAAIDEFYQHFIPNRDVTLWDMMANWAGLVIAYWISAARREKDDRNPES